VEALDMVPVTAAVNLAVVGQKIGSDGQLAAASAMEAAAKVMFDEFARWTAALAALRVG
jgi:hypothetical protein